MEGELELELELERPEKTPDLGSPGWQAWQAGSSTSAIVAGSIKINQ